jgi:hypothetical protein
VNKARPTRRGEHISSTYVPARPEIDHETGNTIATLSESSVSGARAL